MKTPTTADMKIGTTIVNAYGEWTVTSVKPYGWDVRKGNGSVVVFEDNLQFYTLKP